MTIKQLLGEATPLPWQARPTGILANCNGNIRFIAELKTHGGGLYPDADRQDRADWQLVETAVNAFPLLVQALERARAALAIDNPGLQAETEAGIIALLAKIENDIPPIP
jgi:hypothetical protein